MAAASAITWPDRYVPGTTDNFVSNEVVVKGVDVQRIWELLVDINGWEG